MRTWLHIAAAVTFTIRDSIVGATAIESEVCLGSDAEQPVVKPELGSALLQRRSVKSVANLSMQEDQGPVEEPPVMDPGVPQLVDSVPITQEGFAAIQEQCCLLTFDLYSRNLLQELGMEICDEGCFNGWIPFFYCNLCRTLDNYTQQIMAKSNELCACFKPAGQCPTGTGGGLPQPCVDSNIGVYNHTAHRRRNCPGLSTSPEPFDGDDDLDLNLGSGSTTKQSEMTTTTTLTPSGNEKDDCTLVHKGGRNGTTSRSALQDRPQVKIEILRGSNITEPNDASFVVVSLGDGQSHKTDSVIQNPSPEWNEIVTFDMQPEVEFLDVKVLKELPFDDFPLLGAARVPLKGLKFGEPIEEWYEISGGVAKQSPKILLRLTLMHKGTKLETVKEMDGGVIQFFTGGLEKESDREQAAKILKLDWTKDGFLEPGSRNTIQNGGYRGGAIARDVNSNIVAVQVLSEVTKELSGEGFDISVKEAKRLEVHAEWGENAWKWKAWMWQGLVAAGKDLGHAALFTKICLSDFSSFKKYAVDIMAIDDPSYQPYNYPTGVLQPYVVGYVDPEVQYPLQDVYVFLMHPLQDPEGVSFEDYKAALLANLIKSDANMAEQWRERYMRPGQWRKNGEFTRRMLAEVFRRNQILSDPSLSAENLKTLSAWLGLPE
mmetsp:Transcript_155629/g.286903  ORF Transcript_155629/g.286903 Transcript_155629/m.286903 type:complete len:659 (+) Transcript_155629:90-2066(+)